jgi:hypothetical protein
MKTLWRLVIGLMGVFGAEAADATAPAVPDPAAPGLRLATFDVDVTPPIGAWMAYDPVTNRWDLGLRARGMALLGAGEPIVLCAVDWIGIANEGHDAFRTALAGAAGTVPSRVAIHTVHQHDAPECDFAAERLLRETGRDPRQYAGGYQREAIDRLAAAVRESLPRARRITHLGLGEARVEQVASNRRILGADGKVRATRWTATVDPQVRAEPEGVIDPIVSLVSLWDGERPVAVLSYYATHPQSYYRTGLPNPDFPGLARFFRQLAVPAALHVHFNGAGGNVTAGKYNDGSPENRLALAQRLADGMRRAWEATRREPLAAAAVSWEIEAVALPPAKHITIDGLEARLRAADTNFTGQGQASRLAWLQRCRAGHKVEVASLGLGRARILHLPGETFVEYQLAAKAVRPDRFVAVAGYGDYGPGYIGTAVAYDEGGYETSPAASNVAPEVEGILSAAIRRLLH